MTSPVTDKTNPQHTHTHNPHKTHKNTKVFDLVLPVGETWDSS